MRKGKEPALAARIQRSVDERMGLPIWVGEVDGAVVLAGTVSSSDERDRVREIAVSLAPDREIRNELEVRQQLPTPEMEDALRTSREELASEELPEFPEAQWLGLDDLGEVPLESNAIEVMDDSVYDEEPASEVEPAYFPPTDPVITSDVHGHIEVLGGFTPTSLTEIEVEPSAEDDRPGDEALADAIRRELREDAATTDLKVTVAVEEGVAYLRGQVPALDDALNAEAVASAVPGVREVTEELDIEGM